jgi:hypothetical protein
MLIDTMSAHPPSESNNEYHYKSIVPQHEVWGFANERQWLFAHRKFRNQCALEALAAENKQPENGARTAFVRLSDGIAFADLR